jgi:nicotinamidase-related amidase
VLQTRTTGVGKTPALLVVDATQGFTDPACPLGDDYAPEIERINDLLALAHQCGWPVFLSAVVYRDPAAAPVFRQKLPDLNLLTPGSRWTQLDPRLHLGDGDRVFEKIHASCFHGTGLAHWLRQHDVDTVVVCGFTTSGCVRASAVDALQHDFRTLVVRDAVGDRDPDAHAANLKDLDLKYADVVDSADLACRP